MVKVTAMYRRRVLWVMIGSLGACQSGCKTRVDCAAARVPVGAMNINKIMLVNPEEPKNASNQSYTKSHKTNNTTPHVSTSPNYFER